MHKFNRNFIKKLQEIMCQPLPCKNYMHFTGSKCNTGKCSRFYREYICSAFSALYWFEIKYVDIKNCWTCLSDDKKFYPFVGWPFCAFQGYFLLRNHELVMWSETCKDHNVCDYLKWNLATLKGPTVFCLKTLPNSLRIIDRVASLRVQRCADLK